MDTLAAAFTNDAAQWVGPDGRTLSDRIWSARADLRRRIDQTIRDGILNGDSVEQATDSLVAYVKPSYARYGSGKGRYAATRLASHEMRRAHALAVRETSLTDPAGGYLRYNTAAGHIDPDICDDRANHDEGYGRGVYPAKDAPVPPEHVGCRCFLEALRSVNRQEMRDVVEQLRVEYDLADPPDLAPDELLVFRRETAGVRQAVQLMFRAWFEQTGLVSREALVATSPTVREWVDGVKRDKMRRRGL